MNRILPIAIAATLSAISAHAVYAAPVVSGFILGPDDGTSINMRIVNDASSTVNIKSIQLNGNTAISFPLIWDGVGPSSGPDQFGQLVFLDEDTRVLTIEFITAFNPGESFNLGPMDVDGDPTPEIVQVNHLLGVQALFTFSDDTTGLYKFVPNPNPIGAAGGGLVLVPVEYADSVPEPATLALFGAGLAALGFTRRKRPAGAPAAALTCCNSAA
jgi:hypothetical protein